MRTYRLLIGILVLAVLASTCQDRRNGQGEPSNPTAKENGMEAPDSALRHLKAAEIVSVDLARYTFNDWEAMALSRGKELISILNRGRPWRPDISKGPAPLLPPFTHHVRFTMSDGKSVLVGVTHDCMYFEVQGAEGILTLSSEDGGVLKTILNSSK